MALARAVFACARRAAGTVTELYAGKYLMTVATLWWPVMAMVSGSGMAWRPASVTNPARNAGQAGAAAASCRRAGAIGRGGPQREGVAAAREELAAKSRDVLLVRTELAIPPGGLQHTLTVVVQSLLHQHQTPSS